MTDVAMIPVSALRSRSPMGQDAQTVLMRVPLEHALALGDGTATVIEEGVEIRTSPAQWAYSAQLAFESSGDADVTRLIAVQIEVREGVLGVGLLSEDRSGWVGRESIKAGSGIQTRTLRMPADMTQCCLVFENWGGGGQAASAVLRQVDVIADEGELQFKLALDAELAGRRDEAIARYLQVLHVDPAHVEARARLGGLRFEAPRQPFIEQVNSRISLDVCAAVIQIRNPCNYRCFYCVAAGHNDEPVQEFDLKKIEQTYRTFKAKLITTTFECGGGEPTIHPQFPELLKICSSYGPVDIPSNNSQNPERWLPRDTARRILIRSALHPESEEKLDRYIRYARYLIDAGCTFSSVFIAHPTRIHKLPEYRLRMADAGIRFYAVSYIGEYDGQRYPHAYSEGQKHLLGLDEDSRQWVHKIEPHVTRLRNFRGVPCIAGYRYIYIANDGSLRRCVYDPHRVIDAPLTKPEPCGVDRCSCGIWLDKVNWVQSVQYYNQFATPIGEAIPVDWMEPLARELGYASADDAMTAEGITMFEALMSAYAKDEIPG